MPSGRTTIRADTTLGLLYCPARMRRKTPGQRIIGGFTNSFSLVPLTFCPVEWFSPNGAHGTVPCAHAVAPEPTAPRRSHQTGQPFPLRFLHQKGHRPPRRTPVRDHHCPHALTFSEGPGLRHTRILMHLVGTFWPISQERILNGIGPLHDRTERRKKSS